MLSHYMRSKKRKERKKKNLRSLCERITHESCLWYVDGDEYKALSGGKYGGYLIRGQTKAYEYSYMHYIFHLNDMW
jgi:hypothetical protein